VIHQVHTVRQAREAAERGVDAIIAQGSEAGGQGPPLGVGTLALVAQVVDAVDPIPVLAAGGIADGRGLAAALALGAQGANIGTRFLASEEASAHAAWKRSIIAAESEDVVRFEEWREFFPPASGRAYDVVPRVIRTPFVDEWRGRRDDVRGEAERLRGEVITALREDRIHELVPFAGQTAGLIREVLPAAEIVRRIVAEAEQALERAGRLVR
jgi:nitronate monooxygenase/enoyl-[acyl-carrier protein] reductase II